MQNRRLLFLVLFLAISLNSYCLYHYVKVSPVLENSSFHVRSKLVTGDLILRRGKGVISNWFARMSMHDPYFSHAGMVLIKQGKACVISSTQDHIPSGVVEEDIEAFLDKEITEGYAVYRYPLSDTQRSSLESQLLHDLHQHLPFDASFELTDDSAYYCTEYLYDRLNRVAPGIISGISTTGDWNYVAPEDLYLRAPGRFIEASR